MLIIQIEPLENGAHRSQTYTGTPPEGYIAVPPELETEAFSYLPFIELEIVDGVLGGVSQGVIPPAPEPDPDPDKDSYVTWGDLAEAYTEGVNSI